MRSHGSFLGFAGRDALYFLLLLLVFFGVSQIRPHAIQDAHLIYLPALHSNTSALGYIQGEHWLACGESLNHAARVMQDQAQSLAALHGGQGLVFQPLDVLLTNPDVCFLRATVVKSS